MIHACLLVVALAALGAGQSGTVTDKAFQIASKDVGKVVVSSGYPVRDFEVELVVQADGPGSVLDTVGINGAPVGSWSISIGPDYRPFFSLWDGQKWWQLVAQATVPRGKPGRLKFVRQAGKIRSWVDGAEDASLSSSVPLSGEPVYAGDFKGDEHWGSGYNIHGGMVGSIRVVYFGPPRGGSAPTAPVATASGDYVVDKTGGLSASGIAALAARVKAIRDAKSVGLQIFLTDLTESDDRDRLGRPALADLGTAVGKPSAVIVLTTDRVSVFFNTTWVDLIGREKLQNSINGIDVGDQVARANTVLDRLYGDVSAPTEPTDPGPGEKPPVDEGPVDVIPVIRPPSRPITGATTDLAKDKPSVVKLPGNATITIPPQTEIAQVVTSVGPTEATKLPDAKLFGPTLALQWEGGANPHTFIPVVRFPASAASGQKNINVVRIGDTIAAGELLRDQVTMLPTRVEPDGSISAIDTFTPPGPESPLLASLGVELAKPTFTTRYGMASYTDALNWKNEPELIRMVPAPTEFERQPAYKLDDAERAKLYARPIKNVVVLVHGHNEYEKGGYVRRDAELPWGVSYKRDVWTQFWKTFRADAKPYLPNTAVFEFIYPTYRPVFKSEMGVDSLGTSLAKAIGDNRELAEAASNGCKFNLFVVAHSMGGLVARAGVNELKNARLRISGSGSVIEPWLDRVLTWGSPHHGSPLVTMRYLLTGGYDMEAAGTVIPLSLLKQNNTYHVGANFFAAMDTPGERALKWDNHRPLNLRKVGWVVPKREIIAEGDVDQAEAKFGLEAGAWLYNPELAAFNAADRFRAKLLPFYGVTSKTIAAKAPLWTRSTYDIITGKHGIVARLAVSSEIGIGAWLNTQLYNNNATVAGGPVNRSDGAVPVESAMGEGVAQKSVFMGDIDHEEFYGAPDSKGTFTRADLASQTSKRTLAELGFNGDKKGKTYPPSVELAMPLPPAPEENGNAAMAIQAKLAWNDDAKPGDRVKEAQVVLLDPQKLTGPAKVVPSKLKVDPDGTIVGTVLAKDLPTKGQKEVPAVRVVFKDKTFLDSSVAAPLDDLLPLLQKSRQVYVGIVGASKFLEVTSKTLIEDVNAYWYMTVPGPATMGGAVAEQIAKAAADYGKTMPVPALSFGGSRFSFQMDTGALRHVATRANWGTTVTDFVGKVTVTGSYDPARRAIVDVDAEYLSDTRTDFTPDPKWKPRSTVESFYPPKAAKTQTLYRNTMKIDAVPFSAITDSRGMSVGSPFNVALPGKSGTPGDYRRIVFFLDGATPKPGATGVTESRYSDTSKPETNNVQKQQIIVRKAGKGVQTQPPGVTIVFVVPL